MLRFRVKGLGWVLGFGCYGDFLFGPLETTKHHRQLFGFDCFCSPSTLLVCALQERYNLKDRQCFPFGHVHVPKSKLYTPF